MNNRYGYLLMIKLICNFARKIRNKCETMNHLITIGIPVFQVEEYIEKCVNSVLNQTYPNMEILAIDDCGNDQSIEIVKQIQNGHPKGNCIKIINQKENKGVSEARNTVIDYAQGKYIFFIDSDDTIEPEAISLLYKKAEEAKADVTYGSYRSVDMQGNVYQQKKGLLPNKVFKGKDDFAHFICSDLSSHINFSSWNILFRSDFIRNNNLRFVTGKGEDFVFLTDFYPYVESAILLSDITYNYLIRSDSIMGRQARNTIPADEVQIVFKNMCYITKTAPRLKNKDYFDVHCAKIMWHKANASCAAIKHHSRFVPQVTYKEICNVMREFPASLSEILRFKRYRYLNLFFYILGHTPDVICICGLYAMGKLKRWL